jgi:hypothetical protein
MDQNTAIALQDNAAVKALVGTLISMTTTIWAYHAKEQEIPEAKENEVIWARKYFSEVEVELEEWWAKRRIHVERQMERDAIFKSVQEIVGKGVVDFVSAFQSKGDFNEAVAEAPQSEQQGGHDDCHEKIALQQAEIKSLQNQVQELRRCQDSRQEI